MGVHTLLLILVLIFTFVFLFAVFVIVIVIIFAVFTSTIIITAILVTSLPGTATIAIPAFKGGIQFLVVGILNVVPIGYWLLHDRLPLSRSSHALCLALAPWSRSFIPVRLRFIKVPEILIVIRILSVIFLNSLFQLPLISILFSNLPRLPFLTQTRVLYLMLDRISLYS